MDDSSPKAPEPGPTLPAPEVEHAALLKWATGKGLHIDPYMGRAESDERKRARTLTERLLDLSDRYNEQAKQGDPPDCLNWMAEQGREYAKSLKELKGKA